MVYMAAIRGLVVLAAIVVTGYVFVKAYQISNSFTKAILAVSITIDFILIIMYVLGIDRPIATIYFARIGAGFTITALAIFIPVKLLFTAYLLLKQRQLRELLG